MADIESDIVSKEGCEASSLKSCPRFFFCDEKTVLLHSPSQI